MVSLYFGLPGCGKTTMYAKLAYQAAYSKKSRYQHIYGNIALTGIDKYIQIDTNDLGKYNLENALILIDEGILHFNSRDYKSFSKAFTEFFLLHRHFNVDVAIFSQSAEGADKRIRDIADRCYYIFKTPLTGSFRSIVWRIPYGIGFSDKKDNGNVNYGEIVQGYYKPPLLTRIFTPNLYRRKYYPYFDSWEKPDWPPLPSARFNKQLAHNIFTLGNVKAKLDDTPKYMIFRRKKLSRLYNDIQQSIDNLSINEIPNVRNPAEGANVDINNICKGV